MFYLHLFFLHFFHLPFLRFSYPSLFCLNFCHILHFFSFPLCVVPSPRLPLLNPLPPPLKNYPFLFLIVGAPPTQSPHSSTRCKHSTNTPQSSTKSTELYTTEEEEIEWGILREEGRERGEGREREGRERKAHGPEQTSWRVGMTDHPGVSKMNWPTGEQRRRNS